MSRPKVCVVAAGGLLLVQAGASLVLARRFALTALSDFTQALLLLLAAFAFLPSISRTQGRVRLFWALMTLGVGFWFAYQAVWTYLEVFLRREVPDPFGWDMVLFLHVVPMMAALALKPHMEQDDRTTRLGSLEFALLLIWWLFLYLYLVIPWQYVHTDVGAYDRNLNVLYFTEKMVFLAGLAVLWWHSNNGWKTVYAHWFGASLLYAVSSDIANWALARHIYYSGSVYDLPLATAMAWMTWVGVLALKLRPLQQPAKKSSSQGVWVARLGMIAIFSLPIFAVFSLFDRVNSPEVRTFRIVSTLACIMVMGAMVFLKQHLLDRELLSLLRASHQSFEDLQRLQTQLVQSEKLAALGQLVGGAAHELNNPLTALQGYSELLTATNLNEQQRSLADKITAQIRRTKSLVSSLLSFAKQVPAEKTLLDINSLVQTAVKLCQPQLTTRNIRIQTELASDLPQVLGDSNQLLQVCLHIINNAGYAMAEKGGQLLVSTGQSEASVFLEFSDSGPGALQPERVFDPFYTTRPVGQGSGLGLSACYGIVQEHNGKILCKNRPQGGATFRVELPAARKNSVAKPDRPAAEVAAAATLTLPPTPH